MKLWKTLLLPFGSLLMICGCSSTALVNLTVPHSGYTVKHDIAYGDDKRQHLDIYVPDARAPNNPVIVFFYGGSWQSGNKSDYLFVGQAFASKGFTTVIADYRLYPQVYFPEFMQDSAKAYTWAHTHIKEYNGNPDNIFVSGHSAGAYIALMLTLNQTYLKNEGGDQSWIKGAIGMAGLYDFLPYTNSGIKAVFSKTVDINTQPIKYARPDLPPIMLVTGDKDVAVSPKNTINMATELRKNGDTVIEDIYPGVDHMGIVLALADGSHSPLTSAPHSKAPVLGDITDFITLQSTEKKK